MSNKITLATIQYIKTLINETRENKTINFFFLFKATPLHMEAPRLGIESDLQLLAYTPATESRDPSHICNLCHKLHEIFIPLKEARD